MCRIVVLITNLLRLFSAVWTAIHNKMYCKPRNKLSRHKKTNKDKMNTLVMEIGSKAPGGRNKVKSTFK